MEKVKEKGDVVFFKKRNGRHCIQKGNKFINGEEKQKMLVAEGLIKLSKANPNKKVEEAAEAAPEEPAAE